MDIKEEKLKELKEVRRAIGIVFLAVLTFLGNIIYKYLDNPENTLYKQTFFITLSILVILFFLIIIISIPIWRIIRNGNG
ncbi:hypothetical protein [Hydrogenivirga sp. 128-5-R1-1]|uniref:hypothetical protein n=1 Tax=Hydrogenivirga sp. 128-5-R1-1 TaxID=392423 RepID=UPI00015F3A60|nr:hypothetical protein [Hydrogenivirga sp. 128-5-R1-1]EDP73877.1 hypothetical protein HG1285_04348 [Hydrogenivirga sp. 128-5-R1-1]